MLDDKFTRLLMLPAVFVLVLQTGRALGSTAPVAPQEKSSTALQDRSPTALQARLDAAEASYKKGDINAAIDQAASLVGLTDSSAFESDRVSHDAQTDLALFQLKAGQPDQSAKWIRALLLDLQLQLPMDPSYGKDPAHLFAESPKLLKSFFAVTLQRFGEKSDTLAIIESLIDNTVPTDYLAQLKPYCRSLQAATDELHETQSVADGELPKYGDALSSLDEPNSETKSDPKLSADRLDKLGKKLDELATQAQQMPVGDVRAALGLYQLALVANSAQR